MTNNRRGHILYIKGHSPLYVASLQCWIATVLKASLAKYFYSPPAQISLCISSNAGLTSSAFKGLAANHVQVVVLVTSGRCWPSAADEEW